MRIMPQEEANKALRLVLIKEAVAKLKKQPSTKGEPEPEFGYEPATCLQLTAEEKDLCGII